MRIKTKDQLVYAYRTKCPDLRDFQVDVNKFYGLNGIYPKIGKDLSLKEVVVLMKNVLVKNPSHVFKGDREDREVIVEEFLEK